MNRKTGKGIKEKIKRIPGFNFVLPWVLTIYRPIYRGLNRIIEYKETKEILKICKRKDVKEVILIYDLLASPPTYGDFFYTLMLARFFLMFEKKLYFWIIDSEFRQDALEVFLDTERHKFVKELFEISYLLLNKKRGAEIKTCTWNEVHSLLTNSKTLYIPFEKHILKRKPIYVHSFNVLNNLFKQHPEIDTDKFFLSSKDILPYVNIKLPESSYITWQVRHSKKWGWNRNIGDFEFLNVYKSLQDFFPYCKIMIVSDEIGCNYFRDVCKIRGIKALFSKDFSNSFMGDVALILNSEYFFSLRGGGIASVPVFSKIPYGFIAKPVHEVPSGKNKFAVWSTEKQIFINSDKGTPEDVFSLMKDNI